jgi:nitrite reductase/ring-hydroxylating ferredoxin subunit
MNKQSKTTLFLFTVLLSVFIFSCKKNKNDVIPNVYVNFTIDLTDLEFISLTSVGETVTVNKFTNNFGYRAAGFADNGIIIHSGIDEFFAYDRTCPHDYALNESAIKIDIDKSSSMFAVCPVCKTKYGLPANGTPVEGVGRYPLKNYKTSFEGIRFLRVWNSY